MMDGIVSGPASRQPSASHWGLATALEVTKRSPRFDTLAVRGGYDFLAATACEGAVCEPAFFSPAQHFPSSEEMRAALAGERPSWVYGRLGNPTVSYLERAIGLLEGYGTGLDVQATVVSSGMTAIYLAVGQFLVEDKRLRKPNIVAAAACYGGTFHLFTERFGKERGVEVRWVRDPLSAEHWNDAIDRQTRVCFAEVPANPTLQIVDIAAVSEIAHRADLPLIVDSTIATPALLRPIGLGADIVVHSVSKSMSVSGLSIAGSIAARPNLPSKVGAAAMRANFCRYIKEGPLRDIGCILSPFNALMSLCDLRGLRDRMDRMSWKAESIANFLAAHPAVAGVYYPGRAEHPGHAIAARDMVLVDSELDTGRAVNRYGCLLGFTPRGGFEAARSALDRLALIWRANDLGRIKSTATLPAISTHLQQGPENRDRASIPASLIRLSVGGEHLEDLLDDLDRALVPQAP